MTLKLNGTTSGSVSLDAPATGSDVAITLPGTAGTVALTANPTFTGNVTLPDTTTMGSGTTIGAWTSFTPTISCATGTLTSTSITSAAYSQVGKTVYYRFDFTITNSGTGSGELYVTLPVTSRAVTQYGGIAREFNQTGVVCSVGINSNTTSRLEILRYDNATIIGSSRRLIGTIVYEAA